MFKWLCLVLAVVAVAGLGWIANDLRRELKLAVVTVNEHLPAILEKARTSTETLAELSEDVRQLRDLAGLSTQPRDKTLVAYADSVMDLIEASDGNIGTKKFFGKGLHDPVPAKEWGVGARKKAVVLTLVSSSRTEFLTRLCDKVVGTKWYIQPRQGDSIPLLDWIKANHADKN